jgi:hypothetical protein
LVSAALFGMAMSLLAGCGAGEDETSPNQQSSGIEIRGEWESEFGEETITDDVWGSTSIVKFDNDANVAITQNADDAEFSPGKFNRIVWTEPAGGSFYYCWVAFALDSEQEAFDSDATADDSDPETGGCGGFPWTKLSGK